MMVNHLKYPLNSKKYTISLKNLILITFLLITISSDAQQERPPEDYDFKHLRTIYKGDTVNFLIKSKKGKEKTTKPLFIFCRGSLPIPLIIKCDDNGKKGIFNVFVFNPVSLCNNYHLAIISKLHIPPIADQKQLNNDKTFSDSAKQFPKNILKETYLIIMLNETLQLSNFFKNKTGFPIINLLLLDIQMAAHALRYALILRRQEGYPYVFTPVLKGRIIQLRGRMGRSMKYF